MAEFIGDPNLIRGRMTSSGRIQIAGNHSVAVPGAVGIEGSELLILLRPEVVRITGIEDPVAEGSNALSGEVESCSFTGSITRVIVKTEDGPSIIAKMMSERMQSRPATGARVRPCWSSADLESLNKESFLDGTGKRGRNDLASV
ncbi:TOBE domain-containing protein [Bradyrhizobium sp. CCBAU 11445]|uniref:TOBE domain-containing protein n=1 Tax=Bradyrhizobium sp. CCBAU 11445 TaxID=1630896 RepID=UPI002305D2F0|nr:TOBE domain-containing protein [Bradyrhizobium sp. CCBAU 11445]